MKGNCKRGDKCPDSHKAEKPAAPAIKIAVTSSASATAKKSVCFSNAIQTKQYRVPVKEGTRWKTLKDPCQRHSTLRFCDASSFSSPEHLESVKAHAEAARFAGELLREVASKRRLRPKKAWAGPGMTWVVSYDKRKDCVTNDIIMVEYHEDKSALASLSSDESESERRGKRE